MFDITTGEGIYQYRRALGMSRREFGNLLGMKIGSVYTMEVRPRTLDRHRIAVQALIDGKRPPIATADAARKAVLEAVDVLYRLATAR